MVRERNTGGRFKNSGSHLQDFPGGIQYVDDSGRDDISYHIMLDAGVPYRITPAMHVLIDSEVELHTKRYPMAMRMKGVDLVMGATAEMMEKGVHKEKGTVWCDYCIFANTRMCNRMICINDEDLAAYVNAEDPYRDYHKEFEEWRKNIERNPQKNLVISENLIKFRV